MNRIKLIYTPSQVDFFELDYIKAQDVLEGNIILLVPEQFAFDVEKYLINKMASKGLFNVRVYGFKKLLYEFSYLVGLDSENIISDFGKSLIMMRILKKLDSKLDLYKASYRSKSYVEMIISQLDALRTEELSDVDLLELSEDLALNQVVLSKKLYELSIILKEYLAFFKNDKVDEIELAKRLKDYFLSNEDNFIFDKYSLIVDGFTGMSQSETALITAMSAKAEDSFIRILSAKTGVAARYSHKFLSQIEHSFQSINEKYLIEEISLPVKQAEKNALAFASLFEYENRNLSHKPNIEIACTKNKEEEIIYLAQNILAKMKTGNYLWSDFAIITSNIENYEYQIDKIFQKYSIPYFRDESVPVTAYDFVQFIISSLKSVNNNFSNKNVIDTIKLSSYLTMDFAEFSYNYSMATDIERYVLTMNVNYDRWFRTQSFKFLYNENTEAEKDAIIKYKNSVLYALKDLRDDFKTNDLLKDKLASLQKYLDKFKFDNLLDEKILYYSDNEDEESLKKFMAIKKALADVFEQIIAFSDDIELSTEQFVELFISSLSLYKAGMTPPNTIKVLAGSIERSKFIGVKQLYVLGASDGSLPSSTFSAKSIFTSNELSYLDEFSAFDFKTVVKFMDKEVFDLYEKIILATEKTTFTYPKQNNKMEEIKESLWVKNLKKIYGIEENYFESSLENIAKTGVKNPFYEHIFLFEDAKNLNQQNIDDEFAEYVDAYLNAENAIQPSLHKNVDDYVKKVAKLDAKNDVNSYKLSVSRLEKQALCPYGFFVEYALRPVKNEYNDVDYAMMGNVFHRALEHFVKVYVDSKNKDEFAKNSEQILKDLFMQSQDQEEVLKINTDLKSRFQYFEPSIKYIAKAIISQLATTDACHLKTITEKAFTHTFKNKEENKELLIEGKIDRLDVINYNGKDYLRVVDYKTGIKEFNEAELKEGLQLQLFTYLKALLDGEYQGAEALGVFYHSVRESFSDDVEIAEENDEFANDDFDKQIIQNYKLSGRYLADEDVLKAVDKALYQQGQSLTANINLTKKGTLNKRSGTLIDKEKFNELFEITEANIFRLLEEISNADITVKKHDTKDYPCPYCGYNGILKLDKNKYRNIFE